MQTLVDADACPVKDIIVRLAKQRSIPVTMLIDTSHELNDGYSTVVIVDKQADSVDFALMGLLTRNDIVVTQDYGYITVILFLHWRLQPYYIIAGIGFWRYFFGDMCPFKAF